MRPTLILLDRDVPNSAALSLLVKLKEDEPLKPIPVVVQASAGDGL
jgi:CheY-like chemotaxis protein